MLHPVDFVPKVFLFVFQGADSSENENNNEDNPHQLLDIDLDEPLRADERLPIQEHHIVTDIPEVAEDDTLFKKTKSGGHHKKEKKVKLQQIGNYIQKIILTAFRKNNQHG